MIVFNKIQFSSLSRFLWLFYGFYDLALPFDFNYFRLSRVFHFCIFIFPLFSAAFLFLIIQNNLFIEFLRFHFFNFALSFYQFLKFASQIKTNVHICIRTSFCRHNCLIKRRSYDLSSSVKSTSAFSRFFFSFFFALINFDALKFAVSSENKKPSKFLIALFQNYRLIFVIFKRLFLSKMICFEHESD